MAYFECTIGGGTNATITVTYDAVLYDKTITCSNGIDTYTQTTTSSGVTEFEVDAEGSWTITCDGISKTVDVVFNYDVAMTVTKNITVYSAANDTLSFTDASGSKTVTTDSSGVGIVAISFASGNTVTFTSTVAKNPNNTAQPYSKQVTLDENTTEVYIMPDGAWYWYGFTRSEFASYAAMVTGETSNVLAPVLTKNTNSFTVYPALHIVDGGTNRSRGTVFFNSATLPSIISTADYNKVKMLVSGNLQSRDGYAYRAAFRLLSANTMANNYSAYTYYSSGAAPTPLTGSFTDLLITSDFLNEYDYLGVLSYDDGCAGNNPSVNNTVTVSAIWFE